MAHRVMLSGLFCVVLCVGAFGGLPALQAHPGTLPQTTSVKFQPGNNERILVRTTIGLLVSSDGGDSFAWVCEGAVGYGNKYDPDFAVSQDGDIYATTFSGLRVSRDGACSFAPTNFYGDPRRADSSLPLRGHFVSEVEVASDGKVWACTATAAQSNDVYISSDGSSFHSAHSWHPEALWKTLRVSESNPDVAYLSGYLNEKVLAARPLALLPLGADKSPTTDAESRQRIGPVIRRARALLYKTINGGDSWIELGVDDFAFGGNPVLSIEAVSAQDPDLVYARVQGVRDQLGDDLYRSIDGGVHFKKVLEMRDSINAFALRQDDQVVVGTAGPCAEDLGSSDGEIPDKGCVRVSEDGSPGTWTTPSVEPKLECLAERASDRMLVGCAANWDPDNFALGVSSDNGESWKKSLRFSEVAGPLQCPANTQQATCEALDWPPLCGQLGICVDDDAGTGPDDAISAWPPAEGCMGCQAGGSGSRSALFLIVLALLVARPKRRT